MVGKHQICTGRSFDHKNRGRKSVSRLNCHRTDEGVPSDLTPSPSLAGRGESARLDFVGIARGFIHGRGNSEIQVTVTSEVTVTFWSFPQPDKWGG
jgi:hypothetical protein